MLSQFYSNDSDIVYQRIARTVAIRFRPSFIKGATDKIRREKEEEKKKKKKKKKMLFRDI